MKLLKFLMNIKIKKIKQYIKIDLVYFFYYKNVRYKFFINYIIIPVDFMKKIMIVEDDEIIREELYCLLKNSNYEPILIKDFKNSKKEINTPIIMVTSNTNKIDEVVSYSYGADEKEINKVLFKQTLILFITPLSLAILHSIFGLKFCTFILKSVGIKSVLDGSVMTFVFLLLIYGLYFIITYMCGKNIIKERA